MNFPILLGAQPAGADGGGSMLLSLGPIVLIFIIFYFLLIRPQQKKQKEHKKLLGALGKGDKVVTNSGMFGVISSINEEKNIVVLKISENVKVEFTKSSIAGKIE